MVFIVKAKEAVSHASLIPVKRVTINAVDMMAAALIVAINAVVIMGAAPIVAKNVRDAVPVVMTLRTTQKMKDLLTLTITHTAIHTIIFTPIKTILRITTPRLDSIMEELLK